ncbi:hypothetical protein N2152v2_000192 [Parachlorella kessleri]
MSTGIVSLVVASFPYSLPAQKEVGWGIWWANLTLFCLFLTLMVSRLLTSLSGSKLLLSDPVQPLYLGAIPMSLATIVNGFPLFLAPRWGPAVPTAALVLWAIAAGLSGLCSLLLPLHLFIRHQHSLDSVLGAWLLPAIPGLVAAASGALVAQSCSPAVSRQVLLGSVVLWGLGFMPSMLILVAFFLR